MCRRLSSGAGGAHSSSLSVRISSAADPPHCRSVAAHNKTASERKGVQTGEVHACSDSDEATAGAHRCRHPATAALAQHSNPNPSLTRCSLRRCCCCRHLAVAHAPANTTAPSARQHTRDIHLKERRQRTASQHRHGSRSVAPSPLASLGQPPHSSTAARPTHRIISILL